MASEIRVDKINSLSGVGTVTLSPTGVDIAGITTVATLKATTGIVTTLTATTGIVTTLTTNTLTANSTAKVGSGVTLSPDGDIFATGVTTATTFVGALTGTASANAVLTGSTNDTLVTVTGANAIQGESNLTFNGSTVEIGNNGSSYTLTGGSAKHEIGASGSDNDLIIQNNKTAVNATSNIIFKGSGSGGASVSEKLRIDSSGHLILGATSSIGNQYSNNFTVSDSSGHAGIQIEGNNSNSNYASIYMGDAGNRYRSFLETQLGSNGNFTIATTGSGPIRFNNSGGERMRVQGSGGISFNGDTAAANALDDYEEGSWTPDLNGGGSSTWTSKDGKYQKVGNTVTCWMRVDGGSNPRSGSSGHLTIYNIPFALTGDSNQVLGPCGANVDSGSPVGQNFIVSSSGSGNPFIRSGGQNTTGITVSYFTAVFTYNTTS